MQRNLVDVINVSCGTGGSETLHSTRRKAKTIETHGYYQHGTGFPAVNGDPKLFPFYANLPIKVCN